MSDHLMPNDRVDHDDPDHAPGGSCVDCRTRTIYTDGETRDVTDAEARMLVSLGVCIPHPGIGFHGIVDGDLRLADGAEWEAVEWVITRYGEANRRANEQAVDAPLNGVYLVHREEEDEPLWAFANDADADAVVTLLKRAGTTAWTSFQPIARSLDEREIREVIGDVLGGTHYDLLTPDGAETEKLSGLIRAAVEQENEALDAYFGAADDDGARA